MPVASDVSQKVLAADAVRQAGRGQCGDAPHRARAVAIEGGHARVRHVPVVPAEQLVAAVARQNDRHVTARHLRHVPGRDRRRVGERFVEMPHEPIENADGVRLHDELVVIGSEMPRDAPGVLELVERRLVEADRERLHASARRLGHQADDEARVDAA